jgi:hypothetical protein
MGDRTELALGTRTMLITTNANGIPFEVYSEVVNGAGARPCLRLFFEVDGVYVDANDFDVALCLARQLEATK